MLAETERFRRAKAGRWEKRIACSGPIRGHLPCLINRLLNPGDFTPSGARMFGNGYVADSECDGEGMG